MKSIRTLLSTLPSIMPKKTSSNSPEAFDPTHPEGNCEEKYEKLQQAYQNVCLERDLLRRAIKVYAKYFR